MLKEKTLMAGETFHIFLLSLMSKSEKRFRKTEIAIKEIPRMLLILRLMCYVIISLLFVPALTDLLLAYTDIVHPGKTITAVRIHSTAPKIDGILNDEIWQQAVISTGFTQRNPDEGEAATESTTVRIVYDDEAIYIGIIAYDREPEKIVARLVRRDQWTEADRISVNLDPYHDHQTGYWFSINAAGTLEDGYLYNDDWDDSTWNGVWDARCTMHTQGWSTEFKIPYHVLRFSAKEEYTWGINIIRYISRKKEDDFWVMVPRKEGGWTSS